MADGLFASWGQGGGGGGGCLHSKAACYMHVGMVSQHLLHLLLPFASRLRPRRIAGGENGLCI